MNLQHGGRTTYVKFAGLQSKPNSAVPQKPNKQLARHNWHIGLKP